MGWLYVPESEDWSWASESLLETDTAVWATSSGKPLPRLLSWRGWKTRPWIRRLWPTVSNPSMAARGVERWISLLRDSRVRPSRSRGGAKELTTTAGSGRKSGASVATWGRTCSSWRTSQGSLLTGELSEAFSGTWPKAGGLRNGCAFERPTWAPARNAGGCSYWPGARAEDSESCGNHPGASDSLTGVTRDWPAPTVSSLDNRKGASKNSGDGLQTAAKNWATPQAHDIDPGDPKRVGRYGTKHGGRNLTDDVMLWQAPATDSFRSRGGDRKDEKGLDQQARCWPAPDANVVNDQESIESWEARLEGNRRGKPLTIASQRFRPALPMKTAGETFSIDEDALILSLQSTGRKPLLSPRFVAWLMGWPAGWTGFERVETASYLCRQRRLLSSLRGGR